MGHAIGYDKRSQQEQFKSRRKKPNACIPYKPGERNSQKEQDQIGKNSGRKNDPIFQIFNHPLYTHIFNLILSVRKLILV